jgi:Dolichyl-phosphate-mannose-protein mannosyltransferase
MGDMRPERTLQPWRLRRPARLFLPFVLLLSLALNLWGNDWGKAERWHPDEVTKLALRMVTERTLNPGRFAYGALHTNVLVLAAVAPVGVYTLLFDRQPDETRDADAYKAWKARQAARVSVLARSVSALLGAAQVFLTCLIGTIAFGEVVGLLGALFLAVSPYFVVIAHFATVDSAANFWYWLSVLFAVLVWRRGAGAWYAAAAFTAGLATGIKADRLLAVVPLLTAHVFRGEGLRLQRLLGFGLLVPAAYVLANPWLLISPFDFLDGTTRELFFNMMREPPSGEAPYVSMLVDTARGLGLPLFLGAIAGTVYAVFNAVRDRNRAAVSLLLAAVMPYCLIFGSRHAAAWYVPFFFPAAALFAAYGAVDAFRACGQRRYALGLGVLVAGIAGFSLLEAVAFDLRFVNDSRYQVAEWINRELPKGASIGIGPRGPSLSEKKYRVLERPMDPRYLEFAAPWQEKLEHDPLYGSIRQLILNLEHYFGKELGLSVREQPYRDWAEGAATAVTDPEQWRQALPDYVVLVDYLESERIAALRAPDSGYRLIARFRYRDPFGFKMDFPFVNPEVLVFQREASSSREESSAAQEGSLGCSSPTTPATLPERARQVDADAERALRGTTVGQLCGGHGG